MRPAICSISRCIRDAAWIRRAGAPRAARATARRALITVRSRRAAHAPTARRGNPGRLRARAQVLRRQNRLTLKAIEIAPAGADDSVPPRESK
jgi:hypothetical protein